MSAPSLGHGGTMGLRVDEAIAYPCPQSGLSASTRTRSPLRSVRGVVDAIDREAELLPGVHAALDACEVAGLHLALASGFHASGHRRGARSLRLAARFSVVASAIDDRFGKPHPGIFLRCAESPRRSSRSNVSSSEDSLNGCLAAKAARMAVVAIPHRDDSVDPRFSIADVVVTSLLDLLEGDAAALLGIGQSGAVSITRSSARSRGLTSRGGTAMTRSGGLSPSSSMTSSKTVPPRGIVLRDRSRRPRPGRGTFPSTWTIIVTRSSAIAASS